MSAAASRPYHRMRRPTVKAERLGHRMGRYRWTGRYAHAYCRHCGALVILNTAPVDDEQAAFGGALEAQCYVTRGIKAAMGGNA